MTFLPLLVLGVLIQYDMGAQVFNCPPNQIKFEKLIGLRPDQYQTNNLLYRGKPNVPVTLECLQSCDQDSNCASFVLYYNSSECYTYQDSDITIQNYEYDSVPLTDVAWFRKVCNVNPSCEKAWIFETVAGADFIGFDSKFVGNISRDQCIRSCVQERSFVCRSIKFYVADASNVDSVGTCTLSEMDRHLVPSSFRVSRYENEYIENQCVNTSTVDYCAYEEYEDTTLKHDDLLLTTQSENQCRENCETLRSFNCRGYSVIPLNNEGSRKTYNCFLHSEDSKLAGPKLLVNFHGGKYYEKARCLNVSASCDDKFMTITYSPEQPFSGRIYTNGFSDTLPCYADGNYRANVMLELPLGQNRCGVVEEQTSATPLRILRTVLLVIQYNALIQTQVDRYVRVGCAIGEGNDEITLGTNINFTNTHPNKGSTIINNSSVLPMVTIRVVDFHTKLPTRDTEIGQELQLIIEIKPGNGPYDIWAGHLVATSDNGQDSILLLDDNGCPTQSQIFLPFSKVVTSDSRMLVSTFQAFKFTSSPVVKFSVMVHFCTLRCLPLKCPSTVRQRRETNHSYSNATVVPVNGSDDGYIEVMPLNLLLIVRGSIAKSDQLIIGKDKILIAGTDWFTHEVCVDYALFVGLGVCWIILQIVILVCCFLLIRKYKKYFDIAYTRHLDEHTFGDTHQSFGLGGENLNRRVRWADQ